MPLPRPNEAEERRIISDALRPLFPSGHRLVARRISHEVQQIDVKARRAQQHGDEARSPEEIKEAEAQVDCAA